MSGINKCIFVGHVGKAEERATTSGEAIVNFSIAVNESWTDKNSGEKKERVEWIPCSMFGKRAKALGQYITKGKQLYVEGKWQTRTWEKDGVKRYSTECIVQEIQLLGGGGKSGERSRQDDDGGSHGGGGYEAGPGASDDIPFARNESSNGFDSTIGERWNRANDRLI
jgi:single-strand DNA-binding protein